MRCIKRLEYNYAFDSLAFFNAPPVPSATVAFYGANPKPLEAIANISGPVLGIYAGEDERINSGIPAFVESMVKHKKTFEMKLYRGVQHAFFTETMPTYDKSAAEDAWDKALSFFNKYL
jgi:carboxymethylenebutenolidase